MQGYSRLEKIGELEIPIPEIPKGYIQGMELSAKKQKFQKTSIPNIFREIERDEFGAAVWTRQQEEFIWQEFERCDNGYWFMCNGTPTYITGDHYHELNYWKIPLQGRGAGTKEYRDRDRRVHLYYDYCLSKADNCFGVIYMKHRRDGSTHRSNAIVYNRIIKRNNVLVGIQSKTEADAKSVFAKLVNSWRKEPEFMQPIHDGTSDPKSVLRFFEPSERQTKKNRTLKESVALESVIEFRNSKSNAYDGEGLFLYLMNEAGKTTEADVSETWRIVKECLAVGDRITGKGIIESTVEEMEKKGGKNFIKLWSESNPNEINKNGRTTSGLFRLFISCADGLEGFIDEYGGSMIKEATEFIMNTRDDYVSKKKFESLADYKRKYPLTEADALSATNDSCLFDLEILERRKNELDRKSLNGETWLRRGRLVWQNGIQDTKVKFEDDENGNFLVGWLPENMDEFNSYMLKNGVKNPCHSDKGVIGVDPFEADNPGDRARSSQGAAYYFRKYDALREGEYYNSNFVIQYLGRPKKRNFFYEDMIKFAFFCSCHVAVENNKLGCIKYFEERGYGDYLMFRPAITTNKSVEEVEKGEKGIPTGTKTHQQIAEFLENQVIDNGHNLLFVELIDDLIEFDISNTQKFDPTMAAGITLIGGKKIFKNKRPPVNVYEFMKKNKRTALN